MVRSGWLACLVCVIAAAAGAESYEKAATLSVTPSTGLTSSGTQGGPFTPSSIAFTVGNSGDGVLAWTAASSQPWVTVQMAPSGTGTKLLMGSQFSTSGTVSIPLSLYRGTDTLASDGPSAISAVVTYDTDVLQFQGVTQAPQLADWYDKSLAAGESTSGRINIVIFGINRYQMTTYDNQIDDGTTSPRVNPFPLGALTFSIVGAPGSSTNFAMSELAMTNADAVDVPNATFQQGVFSASALPGGASHLFSGNGVATVSLNSSAASLAGSVAGTLHSATVTLSSNGGIATRPVALTVVQNCTAPPAPGQIQASDGDFSAYARVTWAASTGATQYQVYRSEGTNANAADALSGWISGTSYNDTSAAPPAGGGGCSSSSTFTYYNYWVRAKNDCGTSNFSAPNLGYRGSGAKSAQSGPILETALPASGPGEDPLSAEPASPLALHLVAAERLAPRSLWARVESAAGATATWEPQWAADGRRAWVVFTPELIWTPGEVVTVSAGATTVSGKAIPALTKRFQIAVASVKSGGARVWQPVSGVDYTDAAYGTATEAVPTLLGAADAVPEFVEGRGEPVRIGPAEVFSTPQRVWLPLPEGADPGELLVYYYHPSGTERGWYAGDRVEGWLVSDSVLTLETAGDTYLGFLVQFGGVAQLGVPEAQIAPAQASVASLRGGRELAGDALAFAVVMAILAWRGHKSRCRP